MTSHSAQGTPAEKIQQLENRIVTLEKENEGLKKKITLVTAAALAVANNDAEEEIANAKADAKKEIANAKAEAQAAWVQAAAARDEVNDVKAELFDLQARLHSMGHYTY